MNFDAASLINLTNSIYTYTQIYLNKQFEEFSLTTASYPYLLVLNMNEGINQNEISRELNVDKSVCSRTIKKLIDLEYIRKEEDKEDIRAYKLYITDKGRSLIPQITKVTDTWTNILIQGSEEKGSETYIKLLKNVLNNAETYSKSCIDTSV